MIMVLVVATGETDATGGTDATGVTGATGAVLFGRIKSQIASL